MVSSDLSNQMAISRLAVSTASEPLCRRKGKNIQVVGMGVSFWGVCRGWLEDEDQLTKCGRQDVLDDTVKVDTSGG